jgi:hypothetical protein
MLPAFFCAVDGIAIAIFNCLFAHRSFCFTLNDIRFLLQNNYTRNSLSGQLDYVTLSPPNAELSFRSAPHSGACSAPEREAEELGNGKRKPFKNGTALPSPSQVSSAIYFILYATSRIGLTCGKGRGRFSETK